MIDMGLAELYIHLILIGNLRLQQQQLALLCARTPDPVTCMEDLSSRRDIEDSLEYAVNPDVRFTNGQFYHYQDPQALATDLNQACLPTRTTTQICR